MCRWRERNRETERIVHPLTAHGDKLSGLLHIVVKQGALVNATVRSGNASQSVDILVHHCDLLALERARERGSQCN